MEPLKERSFKKMFERPAKKNFLDEVTIDNSKIAAINETAKEKSNLDNITPIQKIREDNAENGVYSGVQETDIDEGVFREKYEKEQAITQDLKNHISELEQKISEAALNDEIDEDLLERIKTIEKEKSDLSNQYQANLQQLQNNYDESQKELQNIKKAYNLKCTEITILNDEKTRLEASKTEIEQMLKNASMAEAEIIQEDDEIIIPEEITNTMAENGRLSALNYDLEKRLEETNEEKAAAQMLYQELRSIMVSIGIEKNLDIFDQTKIELQEKTQTIEHLKRMLGERDQYITTIEKSLMDGIGQMFLKRPTETLPALEMKKQEDPVKETGSDEVIKKKELEIEVTTGDPAERDHLIYCITNEFEQILTIKINEEENQLREKEEKYHLFLNENWPQIKQEANLLKRDGWTMEDIAELLDVQPGDLKKIINKRVPKDGRTT
ncbi:hypothetical protein LNN31_08265 [Acetobacterium wieringae]|uniref:Uncharacterized protein n=1 Tax=Acetobacterium wieringae TaxID=52694 RepID=A0ABY6HIM9_9FIRM|nr:hypothetical protein [Acetobacterium wieringae]UYO64402.1 hypothetical protein LNN31_08265 [Acetobacterium wieringae]VUZ25224.1 Uncharacterised protein [Acetobacterium wieringae]